MPAGDDRARVDDTKELIALPDGFRESSESRADLLRSCKRRGMRALVLAARFEKGKLVERPDEPGGDQ